MSLKASVCWCRARRSVDSHTPSQLQQWKPSLISRAKPTATIKLKYHLKPVLVIHYELLHIQ